MILEKVCFAPPPCYDPSTQKPSDLKEFLPHPVTDVLLVCLDAFLFLLSLVTFGFQTPLVVPAGFVMALSIAGIVELIFKGNMERAGIIAVACAVILAIPLPLGVIAFPAAFCYSIFG